MRCRSLPHLRRHLAATLDLTLWCLGCDVRHLGGNLLVQRGFTRVRPPEGRVGGTMYAAPATAPPAGPEPAGSLGTTSDVPGGRPARLVVWGFALYLGDPARGAGLLLRRHDAAGARLTTPALPAPLWTPDTLPTSRAAADAAEAALLAALLADVARQVGAHEHWVHARCGSAYRPACAARQPRHVRRRQRLGTAELVAAWEVAAEGYAALARAPGPATRPAPRPRLAAAA